MKKLITVDIWGTVLKPTTSNICLIKLAEYLKVPLPNLEIAFSRAISSEKNKTTMASKKNIIFSLLDCLNLPKSNHNVDRVLYKYLNILETYYVANPIVNTFQILKKLEELGHEIAFLSNVGFMPNWLLETIINKTCNNPKNHWRVIGNDEIGHSKPDGLFYLKAIFELKGNISNWVHIGNDWNLDIHPVKSLGAIGIFSDEFLTIQKVLKELNK